MSINTFFINKILKSVPFEVTCVDKKAIVLGESVKGLEVSAPIINYKRLWSQVADYSGHKRWSVKDEQFGAFSQSYSLPQVSGNDPIQKLAIAILLDIQGFASETCLQGNPNQASPEFAVFMALNMFLTEVLPTGLSGPYANELIAYATSETHLMHNSFMLRLHAINEQSENSPAFVEDEEQSETNYFDGFSEDVWPEPDNYASEPSVDEINSPKNPVRELKNLLNSDLLDFDLELHDFLAEVENEAVVIPLFTCPDGTSQNVECLFIRNGLWWRARAISNETTFVIVGETETTFLAKNYAEFTVHVLIEIARRLNRALYGESIEVSPASREIALGRLSGIIASMQRHFDNFLMFNAPLGLEFQEASELIISELPNRYFEDIGAKRPEVW